MKLYGKRQILWIKGTNSISRSSVSLCYKHNFQLYCTGYIFQGSQDIRFEGLVQASCCINVLFFSGDFQIVMGSNRDLQVKKILLLLCIKHDTPEKNRSTERYVEQGRQQTEIDTPQQNVCCQINEAKNQIWLKAINNYWHIQ